MCNTRKLGLRSTKAAAKAVLFSLALPFFSSYAPRASAMRGESNPMPKETSALRYYAAAPLVDNSPKKGKKLELNCKVKGTGIEYVSSDGKTKIVPFSLPDGEESEESACAQDRGFIRTNKRVFVTTPDEDGTTWYVPWFDISEAHEIGIVAWTQSHDACFLFTKDGKVTPIYVEDIRKNEGRKVFTAPPPGASAKMVEFGGVVFIAYDDKVMAFRFNKNDSMTLLIPPYKGAAFSIKDNRLYYGKEGGKMIEIKVEKEEIAYPLDLGR